MIPLVWLAGASGSGKSTAGYGAFRLLADAGIPIAYVDADQLRLATGVSATEDELVAASLVELVPRYAATGARALIVSGIADDVEHLRRLVGDLDVTSVVLRSDANALRERLAARGWGAEQIALALVPHDESFADIVIDTTSAAPAAVASRIAEVVARAAEAPSNPVAEAVASDAQPSRILLATGPGGVGLSTAGWLAYLNLARQGDAVAYLDAFQLGFCPEPERARAEHAAAHAGMFASRGVTTLVVTGGPPTIAALSERWPQAGIAWLAASPETLRERITGRAQGFGPGIPGDWRLGLTGDPLEAAIAAGIAELGSAIPGATVIDTDNATPAAVAAALTQFALRLSDGLFH